jgi:hypothetical protein
MSVRAKPSSPEPSCQESATFGRKQQQTRESAPGGECFIENFRFIIALGLNIRTRGARRKLPSGKFAFSRHPRRQSGASTELVLGDSEADEDDPGMKIALEIVRGLAAA